MTIIEKIFNNYNPLGLPDLIPYKKGNKWGFCNRHKKIITPFIYDDTTIPSEGLTIVKKGWLWGYINKDGIEVTPFIYDKAYPFSEGLAFVKKNGVEFYIDKKGTEYYEK
ncbi:WG repeat-containing protein [Emticicia oligotrophica]|uniref:WG repeat-containing protein n=1 Tax=Emticicia oligotrophica TaxID=312279 RepID=UPI00273BE16B|nr:WG repeat-containing protein [Emticicia oligotrophica]